MPTPFHPPTACVNPLALPTLAEQGDHPHQPRQSLSRPLMAVGRTFFTKDAPNNVSSSYDNTVDFVISCVDTRAARQDMHEAFKRQDGAWRRVGYWLDIGNNASNGQFVLDSPSMTSTGSAKTAYGPSQSCSLDHGHHAREGSLPSCSAAEAWNGRNPSSTTYSPPALLSMMTRLVRYGELSHQGAFLQRRIGPIPAISIDPSY